MSTKSETVTITSAGGTFEGYFAAPEGKTSPGVVVIQEIFGVNSHIRSVVDRLSDAGYAALAPDVFWRVEPGIQLGYAPDDVTAGREIRAKIEVDDTVEDVRATFEALGARPECKSQKLGIVGFCYGGLITYLSAVRHQPACASAYYGGGIPNYLGEVNGLTAPIQFHFGDQDSGIPMEHVDQIREATKDNGTAEVFVYEGAGHGFHCDQRGSYDAPSAKVAWERTLALFAQHLR